MRRQSFFQFKTAALVFGLAALGAHGQPEDTGRPKGTPLSEQLQRCTARAEGLLLETHLSDRFQLLRVRRAYHPDPDVNTNAFRLELRWLTMADTREAANADYTAFVEAFSQTNGQTPPQILFFKFVHACAIPTRQASVHVHVLGTDVGTYRDASGKLVTADSVLRMVVATANVPIKPPTHSVPVLRQDALMRLAGGDTWQPTRAMNLIEQHFRARGGSFQRLEVDQDFLRFDVAGLRGEVVRDERYWEQLEGTLQLTRRPSEIRLRLHLDGRFAAGGSNRPPASSGFRDMETSHTKQLETYAAELLENLRPKLEELLK